MIAEGIVVKKDGDKVVIKIGRKEGCSGCNKCGKLRDSLVNAVGGQDTNPGDSVKVDISDRKYNQSLLFLYILPLFALVGGCLFGFYILPSWFPVKSVDMITLLCGIIASALVYLFVWLFRKKIDSHPVAEVIEVVKEDSECQKL